MFKRGLVALLAALPLFAPAAPALAQTAPGGCQFQRGFAVVADMIPDVVGVCLNNAAPINPNGDTMQETSNGLFTWTKDTNVVEFTTGDRTWVYTDGYGLILRDGNVSYPWEGTTSMVAGIAINSQGEAYDPATGKVLPMDSRVKAG